MTDASSATPPPQPPSPGGRATPQPGSRVTTRDGLLSRELGGDLPCISCGYNLRGLSIRSMCPECGVAVRATILHVVDPHASELQPILHPRALATAIVLWGAGGALAGVLAWLPHIAYVLEALGVPVPARPNVALGVLIGILVSCAGSVGLWRPHLEIPRWKSALAIAGTILYLPLLWAEWRYFQGAGTPNYLRGGAPVHAVRWFIFAAGFIVLIVICTRPMARLLVARSLAMRTGRVDRQTMLGMAAAAGLMVSGGLFSAATGIGAGAFTEVTRAIGLVAIAFGSLLLTIGLIGSFSDCLRIAQAIVFPRPTLRQVIREGAAMPKSRLGRMLDPTLPRESGE